MRRRLHNRFPLLLLFMLAQWPRIARAATLDPGCVAIQLSDSKPVPNLPPRLDVYLTNGCGKDVTAVAIQLRPANGDLSADSGMSLEIEMLDALVPADDRSGDILHSGQSSIQPWVTYPEKGFSASSLSASVTCVLFLDRTAVGDKPDIRRVLDHRAHATTGTQGPASQRLLLGLQILAKISDFDAAAVYFRDAHPVPGSGSYEEYYVVKFSNAFRRMQSRGVWSDYIAQQKAIIERLIALYKEHSQLSAENH